MSTPMFKVLAQSLRLGQPPDTTSAIRVLVEVAEKQQAEIEDLRARLTIAISRLQYAEARLARLTEHAESDGAREPAPGERSGGERPPASSRSEAPRAKPSWPPPAAGPSASATPPPAAPTFSIPGAPRAPSLAIPLASAPLIDSGLDDFNQTLVIDKRDVQQVAGAEAPFPLAPPMAPASERPRIGGGPGSGMPFQSSTEPRRAAEPVRAAEPHRAPEPDPLPDLASEELSFEGDVTVTEQVTRSMMRPRPDSDRE